MRNVNYTHVIIALILGALIYHYFIKGKVSGGSTGPKG